MATDTLYGVMTLFQTSFEPYPSGSERMDYFKSWIDRTAELGSQVIRIPGDWRMLEENGDNVWAQWYVDETTALIRYAGQKGIQVIYEFAQTPDWAHSGGSADGVWAFPDNVQQYAHACAYLQQKFIDAGVAKYVAAWEVWNEPNVKAFWPDGTYRNPNGAADGTDIAVNKAAALQYTSLLNAAYTALHAVDPGVTVLGGALAGTDYEYLRWMLDAGAKFDGISVHPYTRPFDQGDPTPAAPGNDPTDDPEGQGQSASLNERWSFEWGIDKIHDMLVQAGQPENIWLTEMGWRLPHNSSWVYVPNEATQAQYMQSALNLIRDWDFLKAVTVFSLYDAGDGDFGLLRPNGSWRPSAHVLHDFIAGLGDPPPDTGGGGPTPDGPGTLSGTTGDDMLIGQIWRANTIDAKAGNDYIETGRMGDVVDGGDGDDVIVASAGHHLIAGGNGSDTVALLASANGFVVTIVGGHAFIGNSKLSVTLDGIEWLVFDSKNGKTGLNIADFLSHARDAIGGVGNDQITGTAADDFIYGNDGNDQLDGASGSDLMNGGNGDDVFRIDNRGDIVVEMANSGNDTVLASINLRLGHLIEIENLTLEGSASRGSGNAADNIITGTTGNNRLAGLGGNDILIGEDGRDILIGGFGSDVFVFSPGSGKDTIRDFQHGEDVIDLTAIVAMADFSDVARHLSIIGHSVVLTLEDGATIKFSHQHDLSEFQAGDFLLA